MSRHEPNEWEEWVINAMPFLALPAAVLCGLLALQTIRYYEDNPAPTTQKLLALDESTCARLEVEITESVRQGDLSPEDGRAIIDRCYHLFGND